MLETAEHLRGRNWHIQLNAALPLVVALCATVSERRWCADQPVAEVDIRFDDPEEDSGRQSGSTLRLFRGLVRWRMVPVPATSIEAIRPHSCPDAGETIAAIATTAGYAAMKIVLPPAAKEAIRVSQNLRANERIGICAHNNGPRLPTWGPTDNISFRRIARHGCYARRRVRVSLPDIRALPVRLPSIGR